MRLSQIIYAITLAPPNPACYVEVWPETGWEVFMFGWFRRQTVAREFTKAPVLTPIKVVPGDDVIVSLPDYLNSDSAIALLKTFTQQLFGARIHLLCGFGDVQIQRRDGGNQRADGHGGGDPEAPVVAQAFAKPRLELPEPRAEGYVLAITHATSRRIIAVAVPPKEQGDAVTEAVRHTENPQAPLPPDRVDPGVGYYYEEHWVIGMGRPIYLRRPLGDRPEYPPKGEGVGHPGEAAHYE